MVYRRWVCSENKNMSINRFTVVGIISKNEIIPDQIMLYLEEVAWVLVVNY